MVKFSKEPLLRREKCIHFFPIMYDDDFETPRDISKQLESINFSAFLLNNSQLEEKKDDFVPVITKGKVKRWALKNNEISLFNNEQAKTNEPRTQLEVFQEAMKLLFVIGKLIGMNPVQAVLETDVGKIRFTVCYWRFLFCMVIGLGQAVVSVLCLNLFLKTSDIFEALASVSLYSTACVTTLLFIQIGTKWSKLMTDISNCNLDISVDSRIKIKCYIACVIYLICAITKYFLGVNYKTVNILECYPGANVYEELLKHHFKWLFSLNVPVCIPIGIVIQIFSLICTLARSYSDVYIVCMSMYLASILDRINTKIFSASQMNYVSSVHWRMLREEYNRATELVRSFDDVISGLVFACFASNVISICIRIFHILMLSVKTQSSQKCPNYGTGLFAGYDFTIFTTFSVIWLLAKSLTVTLIAASVNKASLLPARALYRVPSTAYCDEVSRFITEVNGTNIALSGLRFFYVTRDLVLSVAGMIVTYELVLLQFSGSDIIS